MSNLLPHTQDMVPEILYRLSGRLGPYGAPGWPPRLRLPRIDVQRDNDPGVSRGAASHP